MVKIGDRQTARVGPAWKITAIEEPSTKFRWNTVPNRDARAVLVGDHKIQPPVLVEVACFHVARIPRHCVTKVLTSLEATCRITPLNCDSLFVVVANQNVEVAIFIEVSGC